ncbi:Ppx/GppA phosphatase family protein [Porphyromonas sp. oral taxon 278 str. W7784]|jgi:putative phosphatase|uniref:Ppx/GppA phosphatase family protein n=1 Tax=Porphyromonas sp. oral taxon 278 TaxID=712437 RepID=UPI0003AD56A4|nr:Ppx/GppA phosphatase [Porphyromonas sp. oral taxon 278]ERJ69877.1 Ppx/GppA phosphatase family protein [Porphyromonas sp. oral taxon 278 str. W7784]
MGKSHYAGIDIGSNAVRLLIKCLNEPGSTEPLSKVQLVRVPLRLGEDAFVDGRISKKKSKQLISLMKAYHELMEIYEVEAFRACATSAMRDAENGMELVEKIYEKTGIKIEIIDGREEAQLISSDLIRALSGQEEEETFLYIDVGGGSTELNLVRGSDLIESRSFDIGTIRQLSGKVRDEERESFGTYVQQLKETYGTLRLVGTGGNINKLLRLGAPSERANICNLPVANLRAVADELRQYTPVERMLIFRLKPDRAEVIVPAADIFLLVAEITEATEIIVPTKGLADGIVDSVCPL